MVSTPTRDRSWGVIGVSPARLARMVSTAVGAMMFDSRSSARTEAKLTRSLASIVRTISPRYRAPSLAGTVKVMVRPVGFRRC
ncbi:hypothetical protein D3C81_1948010 [compost metagenome]